MKKQFSLVLVLFSLVILRGQSWRVEEATSLPEALTNTAVVEGFHRDTAFVYAFGGLDTSKRYSGIHRRSYRLNTRTGVWSRLPDLPDTLGKIAAAASRVKNRLYIIGGYHVYADGNEKSANRVHRFDIATQTFLSDGAPTLVPIDDQVQAVWRDSLVYLVTGWSNTGNVPSVQIYNPTTDTWQFGTSVPLNNTYRSFGASGYIIGDTLFYLGGASMGTNFPAQDVLRKGVINPANPTEIVWSSVVANKSYRAAATAIGKNLFFIGGSATTYNYDGIAYNGTGGVAPLAKSLSLNLVNGRSAEQNLPTIPMDLRGIAEVNDSVRYIIGGMATGQVVSRKTWKLTWQPTTTGANTPPQYFNRKLFKLYPNPVIDTLFIEKNERGIADFDLRLFAADGRLVLVYKNPERVSLRSLAAGVYFAEFTEEGRVVFTAQVLVR
jgi:hypothetical protein